MENSIFKKTTDETNTEMPGPTKNNLKSNRRRNSSKSEDIVDSFADSCQNRSSYGELGILMPIPYMDIPIEMEEYRKNYDKYVSIMNEYIHNVERGKTEKD